MATIQHNLDPHGIAQAYAHGYDHAALGNELTPDLYADENRRHAYKTGWYHATTKINKGEPA